MLLPKHVYPLYIEQFWRSIQLMGFLICGVLLVSGVLRAEVGEAATYYVATTGRDNNSCAQAQSRSTPRQTVTAGLGCLRAGDTLYVRAGTYPEEITNPPGGTDWNHPVTIAAFPGESVTLRPPSGSNRVFTFSNSSVAYIIVDGFRMDASNVTHDAIKMTYSGSDITNTAHHIRIQNSEIFGIGVGCKCNTGGHLILMEGTGFEILNNNIHTNVGTSLTHAIYCKSDHTLIQGNDIHDVSGFGVHVYNEDHPGKAHDNIIVGNRIHGTGCTSCNMNGTDRYTAALLISSGANNTAHNNVIYNNKNGILIDQSATVYYNTIYGSSGSSDGSYCVNNRGGTGTSARNNICYQNTTNTVGGRASYTANDHNLTGSNPLFVNPGVGDFRLQAGSPAINAGVPVALVTTDFVRAARSQGGSPDIGAYAYTGDLWPAPSNLRVR